MMEKTKTPLTLLNVKDLLMPLGEEAKAALRIIALLGGASCARFVGGCVRNALLGVPIADIDVATIFLPQAVCYRLAAAGFRVIPTGIEHGTVTVIIEGGAVEITTLRRDVKTDGRRADVVFTQDWGEDAERRDFTMNALYADETGRVYDPLGQGIEDTRARYVRFVGDAVHRLEEDALRILRFFRFYGMYGFGAPDTAALEACAKMAHRIDGLSRERITQETLKILMAPKVGDLLRLMQSHHILGFMEGVTDGFKGVERLAIRQDMQGRRDVRTRLAALGLPLHDYAVLLALSKRDIRFIKTLRSVGLSGSPQHNALKEAMYRHGRVVAQQAYLMQVEHITPEDMTLLSEWPIPAFSLTGADLIAEGYSPGVALGQELKRRENEWVNAGFSQALSGA